MAQVPFRWEERRSSPRLKLQEGLLKYQIRGSPDSCCAKCADISKGGLSFLNDRFIPRGNALMLEVNILSRVLSFIGKVTWARALPHSDRYHIGIEFWEASLQDKNFLGDYISLQLQRII